MSWALAVLAVLLAGALAAWLVLGAMRRTALRQQAGLPAPAGWPAAGAPLLRASGVGYLGTTYAPSPVRRFSGYGLLGRGTVELAAERAGLRVEPAAAGPWCVPAEDLRGAGVSAGHAGKMLYAERVLLVDWRLGGTLLRSGFALGDEPTARGWAALLQAMAQGGGDHEEARR